MYKKEYKNHKPLIMATVLASLLIGCNGGTSNNPSATSSSTSSKATLSTFSGEEDPTFTNPISFSQKTVMLTLYQSKTVTVNFSSPLQKELTITSPDSGIAVKSISKCVGSTSCELQITANNAHMGTTGYGSILIEATLGGKVETAALNIALNDPSDKSARIQIIPQDYSLIAYAGTKRSFDVYYFKNASASAPTSIVPAFYDEKGKVALADSLPGTLNTGDSMTINLRSSEATGTDKYQDEFTIYDKTNPTSGVSGDASVVLMKVGSVSFAFPNMAVVAGTVVANQMVYMAPSKNSRAAGATSMGLRISEPQLEIPGKVTFISDSCKDQVLSANSSTCAIKFTTGSVTPSSTRNTQDNVYTNINYYAQDVGVKSTTADGKFKTIPFGFRTFTNDEIVMKPSDARNNQFYLQDKDNKAVAKTLTWSMPATNFTEQLSINTSASNNSSSFGGKCLDSGFALGGSNSSCKFNFNFVQGGSGSVAFNAKAQAAKAGDTGITDDYDAKILPFSYTVLSNDMIKFASTSTQIGTNQDSTTELQYTGPKPLTKLKVNFTSLTPEIVELKTQSCYIESAGASCPVAFHTKATGGSGVISATIDGESNPVQFSVNVVDPIDLTSLDFDGGDVLGAANGAHFTKKVKLTGTAGSTKLIVKADDSITLDEDSSCMTASLAAGQECTVGFTVDEGKKLLSSKYITVSSQDNPKITPAKLRVNILDGLGKVGMINAVGQDIKTEQYRAAPGSGYLTIAARTNPWLAIGVVNTDYSKIQGSLTATGNVVIDYIGCGTGESSTTNVVMNATNFGECTVQYHTTSIGDGSIKFNDFNAIGFNDSAFTFSYGDIPDFNIYTGNHGVNVTNPPGNGFAWEGGILGGQERTFAENVTDYLGTQDTNNMLFAVRSVTAGKYTCTFHVNVGDTISTSGIVTNPHFYVNGKQVSDDDCLNQIKVKNASGTLLLDLSISGGDSKNSLPVYSSTSMTLPLDQTTSVLHVKDKASHKTCNVTVTSGDNVEFSGLSFGGSTNFHPKVNGQSVNCS